ncbi:MAG: hypothetical protein N4Q30_05590 [Neisseriaceae bacterium]|nr:hypothetical protein [Neisseriaceae bacterium]
MSANSSLIILILFVFLVVLIALRWSDKKETKKNDVAKQKIFSRNTLKNNTLKNETASSSNVSNEDVINIQNQDGSGQSFKVKNRGVVSSEAINELQEYKVFRELGYYNQAAEVLSELIDSNKKYREVEYIVDLANLYLETQEIDKLAELLEDYASLLDENQLREIVTRGFSIEPSNYRLQLVCSKILQQDPTQLGAEIEKD